MGSSSENTSFHARLRRARELGAQKIECDTLKDSLTEESPLTDVEIASEENETTPEGNDIANLKLGQASTARRMLELKAKLLEGEIDLQKQQIEMRSMYASKAYRFVWLWSIALIVILILEGSQAPTLKIFFIEFNAHEFKLESNVIIALISGVTVNIVAVFVVVIRNLFPSEHRDKKNKASNRSD
ncbi:hypothetical protein I6H07_07315 [Hafnia alvei]|uniref:hypothetical protein n=1 Tax=Hafnia alvei TaxID=569 RepID=UPI000B6B5B33|nr:hypothetical protein [Hafnia alvei]MBI0275646.1 hypothetical protein [Hafnia alvei]PNK98366.1 hypothetical protein CEQ28_012660 [Hafnia alvei]